MSKIIPLIHERRKKEDAKIRKEHGILVCPAGMLKKVLPYIEQNLSRPLVILDFDDTLYMKESIGCRKERDEKVESFFSSLALSMDVIICTARKDNKEVGIGEIAAFCRGIGIVPAAIIYEAKEKAKKLDFLKDRIVMAFDDSASEIRGYAEAGIPAFLTGAFLSREYCSRWKNRVDAMGERRFYEQDYGRTLEDVAGDKLVGSLGDMRRIVDEENRESAFLSAATGDR